MQTASRGPAQISIRTRGPMHQVRMQTRACALRGLPKRASQHAEQVAPRLCVWMYVAGLLV